MASAPAPWLSVPAGWERRMYGAEVAFAAFATHTSGEGHGSLSTQATFSSVEPISAHDFAALLRAAWIDVRFSLHPLLATVSSAPSNELDTEGYSMMYPLVDAEGARRWAEETVTEHEPTTMSALVVSLKDASPTARLSQAGLHWAPSSTDGTFHVVFVGGHWLTDGRGAFKILNQLIRNIDIPPSGEYRWGEEVVRLSLPLAIATGRRTAKSGAVVPLPRSQVDGFLAALVKIDTAFRPCFAHPPSSRNVPRWSPDVIEELCLTESESSVIRHTCRARGITITALFNVILAMVFVEDPAALDEINTVQIPFFATHREDDMLEEHKGSVGLQLTISPFALDARSVQACLDPARSRASLIWSLAVKAKRQLAGATSHDLELTYEHEIIRHLLPALLDGEGEQLYRAAVPFATSVGLITPLFTRDAHSVGQPKWSVVSVANGFTLRWFRPVVHFWEWQGRTTVRIVASQEYHAQHSIKKMKDDIAACVNELLEPVK